MSSRKKNGFSYKRKLSEFLNSETAKKAKVASTRFGDPPDPEVTGLEYDSRKVKPGNIYFALKGLHSDGHDFIIDAVNWGASVVVCEKDPPELSDWVTYIRVKDSRFAMSPIAAAFYDHPSRRLAVIGVTGTEGKSTTVYLIYQLLKLLGRRAGFISTVMHGDGKNEIPNPEHQTTPEAPAVQKMLFDMKLNGADYAVIEASSHGLSKRTNRLGDVVFDVAVITTVTREHLEFHGTWEQYRHDKTELFRGLSKKNILHSKIEDKNRPGRLKAVPCFGVINADDPSASYFAEATRKLTYTFSTKGRSADLSVRMIESGAGGSWYEVYESGHERVLTIRDRLPGAFNAGNVLASLLVVSNILNIDIDEAAAAVPKLKPVRGRMTSLSCGQPFELVVDYAHTPSSFETIFPPLRERLDASGGRIISLFGSGGERDTQKRPEQGRIASLYSDIVILCDEDPRGEDPVAILEDIAAGIKDKTRDKDLFLIPDRPKAIRRAFSLARKGDLVLLLGKGHENSIIYAKKTKPYDEIEEAERAVKELLLAPGGKEKAAGLG